MGDANIYDNNKAREGFSVVKTSTGRENERRLEAQRPPMLILDKRNGLYFSVKAIKFMKCPKYLKVYVNMDRKLMSLEPVDQMGEGVMPFVTDSKRDMMDNGKQVIIRWTGEEILEPLFDMVGDKADQKLNIPLWYDEEANWFVADMKLSEQSTRKVIQRKI